MGFFNRILGRGEGKQDTSGEKKQGAKKLNDLVASLAEKETGMDTVDTLVRIGIPAVEPLIATLQSNNEDALFWAARALGGIGDTRAIEPLINLHENSQSWRVRSAAGMALGQFGDSHAIPTLVDLLKVQNWIREVIRMLAEFGPAAIEPIIASLQEMSESNIYTSAKGNHIAVLGMIGDTRAADVLKAQTAPEKDTELKKLALEALSRLDVQVEISRDQIVNLKDSLLANDYDVRKTAQAQARSVSSFVDDAAFQRAFQASEKLQMAFDDQRKALSGTEPMQACLDAIQLEPNFSAAYVCLSYLHRQYAKKPDDALGWAKKAIQIDPQNLEAWTELGMIHVALGDVLEAARSFHKVVTTKPQHANLEPFARLVAVYKKLDMQDLLNEALLCLTKAGTGLDPDQEREWEHMVMQADTGQLRKAIEENG